MLNFSQANATGWTAWPLTPLGIVVHFEVSGHAGEAQSTQIPICKERLRECQATHLAMQVLGPSWIIPSWFKINKLGGGGCN